MNIICLCESKFKKSTLNLVSDSKYDVFASDPDGKRVTLSVFLGCHGSFNRYVEDGTETAIASLSVSGKTKWEMLDAMVRRAFKVCIFFFF